MDVENGKEATPSGSFDGELRSLASGADIDDGLTEAEKVEIERKLLRKLDWCLIPWLCLLYLCSFLDRTNIGNAKIDGLQASLDNMSGSKYNATLCIFFVSYALAEPITNVMLKYFRPSIFIPTMMILWGTCMTLMGLVDNWSGLMAGRWFLGLCEAGLFPGVSFYLSCWYKRSELGVRTAIFFSAAAFSGSFGGLLAAAITLLDGKSGKPGWAWIFLLEGIFTVLCGAFSLWWVQDFPPDAKFLSDEERIRVIRRLRKDRQSAAGREEMQMLYFKQAVTDYKTWLGMLVYMGTDMPLYGFALFLPSTISGFGYSTTVSQLLTVPPYFVAAIMTVVVGYFADRTRQRGIFNICISLFGIAGFAILAGADSFKVRYAGTFLAALGIYPCISNTISWVANNIEGSYKRGIVLGMVIGWGNLNGIVSSNVYLPWDAPRYRIGHGIVMCYMIFFLFGGSLAMHLLLRRENNARKAGCRNHLTEGLLITEIEMLGDKKPDFIYTV